MSITSQKLPRVFRYNGTEIPDPTPDLQPEAALDVLAVSYPQFANAHINGPSIEGNKLVFVVKVNVGTNG